jgi:mRNA-degrading endonuclease RelE of RelBE toxin-antitoxin system
LQGEYAGMLRLRAGDYRLFVSETGGTLRIHSVRHRKEAYR